MSKVFLEASRKWCRHYTGYAAGEKCRAGIAYATVMTTDPKAANTNAVRTFTLPCLNDPSAMSCPECVRKDEPTAPNRGTNGPITRTTPAV